MYQGYSNQISETSRQEVDKPKNEGLGFIVRVASAFLLVAMSIFAFSSISANRTTISALRSSPGKTLDIWTVYKVTSSIKFGDYQEVGKFLNKYISYTWGQHLGADHTTKVVGNLLNPYQIHFVETDIFNDLDTRTVDDWSTIGESFDATSFNNAFFHNKVQLYVPDLAAHYALLEADSIPMMKRLSATPSSTTNNVAHIGIWMSTAMTVLELVGPSSTLTDTALATFKEWEAGSCMQSHVLSESLDWYKANYDAVEKTDVQLAWEATSGLQTPQGIKVSMPTNTIGGISDTMSLASTVTSNDVTITAHAHTDGSMCRLATITVDNYIIQYVQNEALLANGVTDVTIADWEADITATHSQFISTADTLTSWDRYIDTHIGLYVDVADTSTCDSYYTFVEDAIADNAGGFQYALRVGDGSHYYTATTGLRAWEYNVNYCIQDGTHLCGVIDGNSALEYTTLYSEAMATADCNAITIDASEFDS